MTIVGRISNKRRKSDAVQPRDFKAIAISRVLSDFWICACVLRLVLVPSHNPTSIICFSLETYPPQPEFSYKTVSICSGSVFDDIVAIIVAIMAGPLAILLLNVQRAKWSLPQLR